MSGNEYDEFSMFAPTSPEDAAKQSNPNRGTEVVVDILKPNVLVHKFEEGDNWMRFINTSGAAWFRDISYYETRRGNKVMRVAWPDHFGGSNLLRSVQVGLYNHPEAKMQMRSQKHNKDGWKFEEHRKAYFIASRWENTLGPFGVVSVALGRRPGRDGKARESWGDSLIKLPGETNVDPMLAGNPDYKPKPRWGSIFDPVGGRLVKCSITNAGTKDISATFTPNDTPMPLGAWIPNPQAGGRPRFKPLPQFADLLRGVLPLDQCFQQLTVDEQVDIIRAFVPPHILPFAEEVMQKALAELRRKTVVPGAPVPAAATSAAAPSPAPAVQVPVPAEEPSQLSDEDKLYILVVREMGANFAPLGEANVRQLIKKGIFTTANYKTVATLSVDTLKTFLA